MEGLPVRNSQKLKYASVTTSSESSAPFVIKGVDIWNTHAVIYCEVINPHAGIDYSKPTLIQFDSETFEVGPLTVMSGPLPSIVFATLRSPGPEALQILVQYGDVECRGAIASGERP